MRFRAEVGNTAALIRVFMSSMLTIKRRRLFESWTAAETAEWADCVLLGRH